MEKHKKRSRNDSEMYIENKQHSPTDDMFYWPRLPRDTNSDN